MSKAAVLIIDTDPDTRRLVEAHVDPDRWRIECAATMKTAVDMVKAQQPAALVLNADLPKGWRLCHLLKRSKRWHDLPVLLLSARATEEQFERHRAEPTRADAYVSKPLEEGEFVRALASLLPGAAAPADPTDEAPQPDAPTAPDAATVALQEQLAKRQAELDALQTCFEEVSAGVRELEAAREQDAVIRRAQSVLIDELQSAREAAEAERDALAEQLAAAREALQPIEAELVDTRQRHAGAAAELERTRARLAAALAAVRGFAAQLTALTGDT